MNPADTIGEGFADRLERARRAAGMTYGGIAQKAGISKTHVWELAKGRVFNPTIAMIESLADALGCDPAWLAGWSEVDALERAIDRMGWPEIHAFREHLAQDVLEDAGGFMLRKIKRLFGIKHDTVLSYQNAARAMIANLPNPPASPTDAPYPGSGHSTSPRTSSGDAA